MSTEQKVTITLTEKESEIKEKVQIPESTFESILIDIMENDEELVFDYLSEEYSSMIIGFMRDLDPKSLSYREFIGNQVSYLKEKGKHETVKFVIGIILYLIIWLVVSSGNELNIGLMNFILDIESEDIEITNTNSTQVLIITSNDENRIGNLKVYPTTTSVKKIKFFTKITVKNKDMLRKIASPFYPDLNSDNVKSTEETKQTADLSEKEETNDNSDSDDSLSNLEPTIGECD